MNIFKPCAGIQPGLMTQDEIETLDILLHVLAPDLVIEVGRAFGHSSGLFAAHGVRVISIDIDPASVNPSLPENLVCQLTGDSPRKLDELVSSHPWVKEAKRIVAFLDGLHYADHVVVEAEFFFRLGAAAVIGHDPGFIGPESDRRGSMPAAIQVLARLGRRVVLACDQGVAETKEEVSTGFFVAYPS